MPDLTTLQAVCAKATPGPWTNKYDDGSESSDKIHTVSQDKDGLPKKSIAVVAWGCSCCKSDATPQDKANRDFILTFNPSLVARLLAVVEAATIARKFLTGTGEKFSERTRVAVVQQLDAALTALGGR